MHVASEEPVSDGWCASIKTFGFQFRASFDDARRDARGSLRLVRLCCPPTGLYARFPVLLVTGDKSANPLPGDTEFSGDLSVDEGLLDGGENDET